MHHFCSTTVRLRRGRAGRGSRGGVGVLGRAGWGDPPPELSSRRSCGRRRRPRSGRARWWPSPRTWRTCRGRDRLRGQRGGKKSPWRRIKTGRGARDTPPPSRDVMLQPALPPIWLRSDFVLALGFGDIFSGIEGLGFFSPPSHGERGDLAGDPPPFGVPPPRRSPRSSSSWAHTVRTQISLLMT